MTTPSVPNPLASVSEDEKPGSKRPRRFSMIRDFTIADIITLANGFAGTGSILFTLQYLDTRLNHCLVLAFVLLPFAAFFDYVDGRVARWREEFTPLGAQLDSLADLISFGVAPAVLGFAVGLRGGWDSVILSYFVACGLSRLARYNVTAASLSDDSGKVRYFEGTPIPTSMLIVLLLGVLFWQDRILDALPLGVFKIGPLTWHPLSLVYLLSGSAMISKTLRIPKP